MKFRIPSISFKKILGRISDFLDAHGFFFFVLLLVIGIFVSSYIYFIYVWSVERIEFPIVRRVTELNVDAFNTILEAWDERAQTSEEASSLFPRNIFQ